MDILNSYNYTNDGISSTIKEKLLNAARSINGEIPGGFSWLSLFGDSLLISKEFNKDHAVPLYILIEDGIIISMYKTKENVLILLSGLLPVYFIIDYNKINDSYYTDGIYHSILCSNLEVEEITSTENLKRLLG